jgi:hypothetical protein
MKLGDLVELDVIRGYSKFEQNNRPGSTSSTAKTMVEINNENCVGIVGVDMVYNRIL